MKEIKKTIKEAVNGHSVAYVTAQAFKRATGDVSGESRTEEIDLDTNSLFKNCQTITDIKSAYERFWNDLNPNSEDVVFVSNIKFKQDIQESKKNKIGLTMIKVKPTPKKTIKEAMDPDQKIMLSDLSTGIEEAILKIQKQAGAAGCSDYVKALIQSIKSKAAELTSEISKPEEESHIVDSTKDMLESIDVSKPFEKFKESESKEDLTAMAESIFKQSKNRNLKVLARSLKEAKNITAVNKIFEKIYETADRFNIKIVTELTKKK